MQYEPHQLKAIDLIRAGTIGKVRMIVADNGQNQVGGTWRTNAKLAGGGPLPDIGIYCLNACRYLTGEEPDEVRAILTRPADDPRFKEVERDCFFHLHFPSGIIGSCSSSYNTEKTSRYRVIGDKGSIDLEPGFMYRGLEMRVSDTDGVKKLRVPAVDQFAAEMDAFSSAVSEGKPCRTPGEEGLRDMELIRQIYESAETGRAVKTKPTKPKQA